MFGRIVFSAGSAASYMLVYLYIYLFLAPVFLILSYFDFRNGIKPKMAAPRMFCDICDMFDLHETEDCPRQAMDSPPPPQNSRRVGKKQTEERPYCEICEGK